MTSGAKIGDVTRAAKMYTYDTSTVERVLETGDVLLVLVAVVLETLAALAQLVELVLVIGQLLVLALQLVLVLSQLSGGFVQPATHTREVIALVTYMYSNPSACCFWRPHAVSVDRALLLSTSGVNPRLLVWSDGEAILASGLITRVVLINLFPCLAPYSLHY
jgi:hypothetical protein